MPRVSLSPEYRAYRSHAQLTQGGTVGCFLVLCTCEMNGIFHPIRMVQRFYEAWQSALMKREIQGPAEWAEPWPSSPVCRWLLAQSSSSTGVCEVRG